MANQYTRKDKNASENGAEKKKRLFFNVASGRFKTIKAAAIDAGYSEAAADSYCTVIVGENKNLIDQLRDEFHRSKYLQAEYDAKLARMVLRDLALNSSNDAVRRLASVNLMELAGELKPPERDGEHDKLTPNELQSAIVKIFKRHLKKEPAIPASEQVN